MGGRNSVVAGQARFLYSLMRPSNRVDFDDSELCWLSAGAHLWVVSEWRSLIEGAVRPVGVVVVDVVGDESFELVLVPDDGAVEEFAAQGPDPAFRERVRDRRPDRVLQILRILWPSVRKISSKASMNWMPRSRTSALAPVSWLGRRSRRRRRLGVVGTGSG